MQRQQSHLPTLTLINRRLRNESKTKSKSLLQLIPHRLFYNQQELILTPLGKCHLCIRVKNFKLTNNMRSINNCSLRFRVHCKVDSQAMLTVIKKQVVNEFTFKTKVSRRKLQITTGSCPAVETSMASPQELSARQFEVRLGYFDSRGQLPIIFLDVLNYRGNRCSLLGSCKLQDVNRFKGELKIKGRVSAEFFECRVSIMFEEGLPALPVEESPKQKFRRFLQQKMTEVLRT